MADLIALGKSIRIFLVDGTPTGLRTAEIPNWTGHVLVAPRIRISEALLRPEAAKTGVYLLVGEEAGRAIVYVGEGDSIADRVRKHAKDEDKDFWERVCLITSKDVNLTKAHVRYLESRLVQIIRRSNRAQVRNGNEPSPKILPEGDISDMEFFLGQLQILLPTVGMDFLRPATSPELGSLIPEKSGILLPQSSVPRVTLRLLHKSGVDARAFDNDGEIVVLSGSIGTGQNFKVNHYAPLRQSLIDEGKITILPDGGIQFLEDVPFSSPSAAAAVLNNRNSSGPREWRIEDTDQTLGEWRDALLDSSSKGLEMADF
jgi:hypothetical protein